MPLAQQTRLEARTVGRTLLVHRKGDLDRGAWRLAQRVTDDPEHTVVVVDLPAESPDAAWESVARTVGKALRKRGSSIRLVAGRDGGDGGAARGRWLADRLGRTVVAADGAVLPAAGGGLYIPSTGGAGWTRFEPNRPPRKDSQRFPKLCWESSTLDRVWSVNDHVVSEPLPGGVWIRRVSDDPRRPELRAALVDDLLCRADRLAVVLGSPGGPELSLDDVAGFFGCVPPHLRSAIRFVPYGPVRVPQDVPLGQALADRLGAPIALHTGLPAPAPVGATEVRAIGADGAPGWLPFVKELAYQPRSQTGGVPALPLVLDHRVPLAGLRELRPGVFWYAPDAVLEIIQSGLWMRPPEPCSLAGAIRAVPVDLTGAAVVFDDASPALADRMELLARDVVDRLDPVTRQAARLLPAGEFAAGARSAAAVEPTMPPATEPAVAPAEDAEHWLAEPERTASLVAPGTHWPTADRDPSGAATDDGADSAWYDDNEVTRTLVIPAELLAAAPPVVAPGPARRRRAAGGVLDDDAPRRDRAAEPVAQLPDAVVAPILEAGPVIGLTEDGLVATGPAEQVPAEPEPPVEAAEPVAAVQPVDAVAVLGAAPPVEPEPVDLPDPQPEQPAPPPVVPVVPARPVVSEVDVEPQPVDPIPAAAPVSTVDAFAPAAMPSGFRLESSPDVLVPELNPFESMSAALSSSAAVTEAPAAELDGEPVPQARPAVLLDPSRVQPVPSAQACVAPPGRGIDQERQWLRKTLSQQYDSVANSVARLLSQMPGLRAGSTAADAAALADLVAVRLYLSGAGDALDDAVRTGVPGPHVPLGRCVAAGLRRLPSHRGPVVCNVDLDDAQWQWYRDAKLITEWAFLSALTEPHAGQDGGVQLRIWSMTARRTALVQPDPAARVLFLPGTSFKVLRVDDGPRRAVLLRELAAAEIGPEGQVLAGQVPMDEIALSGLDSADAGWRDGAPALALTGEQAARFGHPVGLRSTPVATHEGSAA